MTNRRNPASSAFALWHSFVIRHSCFVIPPHPRPRGCSGPVGRDLTREIFKIFLGLRGPSMRKGRTLPCPQARRLGPGQEMGGQKTMLKKTLIAFTLCAL